LSGAPKAWAHALLIHSSPPDLSVLKSAPSHVTLRFNGRIEKKVFQAVLLDSSGKKIAIPAQGDSKDSAADSLEVQLPPLPPGQYRLQYRVVAADGHTTPGMIRFSIESPGRT
jgi:methionine-rich copper-binding protein CopC